MAHFAEIDPKTNVVKRVIVAEQDFIDSGAVGDSANWIQTSYNTFGGVHYTPVGHIKDGGVALRKNYAGIGDTYDADRDAFIPPKDFPSWTLNEDTCRWEAPVAYPDDGQLYDWNEETTNWVVNDKTFN
jgi:hypothetical protein